MKKLLFVLLACCVASTGFAQSVIKGNQEITWLGLDFSQARFIGEAAQWKDVGEITDGEIRDKYIPAWNDLFLKEQKKYDVAKYVDRELVHYETVVTEKANNKNYPKTIFSNDPEDYTRLKEADIARLVKAYNFQGKSGVGLLFFVEAMSKGKVQAAAWVTFVDMKTKAVLQTKRLTGKPGGIGFRNYWGTSFLNILKNMSSEMR